MIIPVPKGFTIPKGLKQGDTFDIPAQFRVTSDGLELIMIDDIPLMEEMAEEDDMAAEDEAMSMAAAYEQAMAGGAAQPPTK